MRLLCRSFIFFAVCVGFNLLSAAEVLIPNPRTYFHDEVGVMDQTTERIINSKLADFERATSNQIIVCIFRHMQSAASVADYCTRTAQSWGVGQKGRSNGAVLFIFLDDRKLYISTGYGLEGSLPDALCHRIIEEEIRPYFKTGDFKRGIISGINAIISATRGEYKGTGRSVHDDKSLGDSIGLIRLFVIFVFILGYSIIRSRQHVSYSRLGRSSSWGSGPWIFPSGGSGGGFSSGGGSDGFSGGGGSFGGGGSGGSW